MQLYVAIRPKTAPRLWLMRDGDALKHLFNLPAYASFQYRNANQLPVGCGLALIARHLIFRNPPTSDSAHQQECLQFARADLMQVVARQDENRVLLVGPLDFEHVCNLVLPSGLQQWR